MLPAYASEETGNGKSARVEGCLTHDGKSGREGEAPA